ncbi:hypothetical protein LCGC14_2409770 [marine sediment metagenome]|uniref:Uncharacterized protein n=1 Tax=marine sediment metagenome TaxID=412755 RepID=A0A0F9E505_9ZZZZ
MILRAEVDAGADWCWEVSALDAVEGEFPSVWGHLLLFPLAVLVDPGVASADWHPAIFLAVEFFDVVEGHCNSIRGYSLDPV